MDGDLVMSVVFVLIVIALLCYARLRCKASVHMYPPGPRPLPIIGNMLDFPRRNEAMTYAKWATEYGSISSCTYDPPHPLTMPTQAMCSL